MSIIEKAMEKARQDLGDVKQEGVPPQQQPRPSHPIHPSQVRLRAADAKESSVATRKKNQNIAPRPEIIMARSNVPTQGGEYRLLKEYILALRREQPDKSLFMVTSPMRNEGKTVVSCNLAATLAREFDHTVLLVDVDLRAPTCHKMMGLPDRPKGLSDCLIHNDPFSEHVIHTGIGRLSMLCAGSPINNPAELVTSRRMQKFLLEIKHRYPDRIVLLDTLPVVPFSESRALSRMVDGILLVVRENVTGKAHLDSALCSLEGSPMLGVVYNGASSFGTDKEIFDLVYEY